MTVVGVLGFLVVLTVLVATAGRGPSATPATTSLPPTSGVTVPTVATVPPAPPFAVGTLSLTLTQPGGSDLNLPTTIFYPTVGTAGTSDQANGTPDKSGGPYPLVIFSEGFDIDPSAYTALLDDWAAAGYVVAEPAYPFTTPTSPGGLVRSNIFYHPAELSLVITSMLQDSARSGSLLTGMINPAEVGVIGHSDGGDVSLAAANDSCCRDNRVKAAVILSGAELAWFPGTYYAGAAVPMLVVQGTNDDINPPSCSIQLYNQAPEPKYFLSLAGQTHTSAYTQAGQPLDVVASATIDFLNAYLKGERKDLGTMSVDGTVSGLASLTSAPSLPVTSGLQACPDAPTG